MFQFVGAAVIAVAVAVFNGAGARIIVVSAALSLVAWAGYVAATGLGFEVAAASGVGAFIAASSASSSPTGCTCRRSRSRRRRSCRSCPGRGVPGTARIVESGDDPAVLMTGVTTLAGAATIGIALAWGHRWASTSAAGARDAVERDAGCGRG